MLPGNRIPSIPRNRIKFGIDYAITDAFKVGGDALFVDSQYFAGDESNQAATTAVLCGFQPAHFVSDQQDVSSSTGGWITSSIIAMRPTGLSSIGDDMPNFANGGADFADARTVSPARPRAFYAGLKATF